MIEGAPNLACAASVPSQTVLHLWRPASWPRLRWLSTKFVELPNHFTQDEVTHEKGVLFTYLFQAMAVIMTNGYRVMMPGQHCSQYLTNRYVGFDWFCIIPLPQERVDTGLFEAASRQESGCFFGRLARTADMQSSTSEIEDGLPKLKPGLRQGTLKTSVTIQWQPARVTGDKDILVFSRIGYESYVA